MRNALTELSQAQTIETLRLIVDQKLDIRFQLGVDKPTCLMTMADKNSLVDDICLSYIIHRTNASLSQFVDGMEQLGLVSLIRRNTGLRCLLEYSDSFELDPTILKNHLKTELSPRGSNRQPIEEKLTKRLLDYIDETYKSPRQIDEHEVNLNSFFSFITGLSKLPPIGFDEIAVEFNHEARSQALPNTHTCTCTLVLPVYDEMKYKVVFNEKMDKAILYAGGMHDL